MEFNSALPTSSISCTFDTVLRRILNCINQHHCQTVKACTYSKDPCKCRLSRSSFSRENDRSRVATVKDLHPGPLNDLNPPGLRSQVTVSMKTIPYPSPEPECLYLLTHHPRHLLTHHSRHLLTHHPRHLLTHLRQMNDSSATAFPQTSILNA